MSAKRHLILFARLPRVGAAKSRLARDIGAVGAWRFAEFTTRSMIAGLARDPRWLTWLCLTPDGASAVAERRWRLPAGTGHLAQGRGDIGVRMVRALAAVPPGPRLLIGSDIPGAGAPDIEAAFRQLGTHDIVFGPAEDGGFWLVGARHPHMLHGIFEGVRWSTSHTLADTLANVPYRLSVALAAEKRDVDDGAALAAVMDRP